MVDALDLNQVVSDCERYWRETGVPGRRIADMKLELHQHLLEATSDGRPVESVVGADLADFAETWASEYRERVPKAAWEEVVSGRTGIKRSQRRDLIGYGLAVVAVVADFGKWR